MKQLSSEGPLDGSHAASAERDVPAAIGRFCGDCHALPDVDSFERDVWYEEIRKGYEFYARSGRQDLQPPALASVVEYYRSHAPRRLEFPAAPEVDSGWREKFSVSKLDWKDGDYIVPFVSTVTWLPVMQADRHHLVVCDMRDGSVSLVDPSPQSTSRRVLARLASPARVSVVDLDADGLRDLLVADLGSTNPFDHDLGEVVWLRRLPDSIEFEPHVLLDGMGRIADVVAGDFNDDDLLDLVVAEFGHRQAGGIHLLAGTGSSVESPEFERQRLDLRPGAIRILPHDWNSDGSLDFAVLVSQEYESLEIFARHNAVFDRTTVFRGDDLTFGSSGIEGVDLDGDGDLDMLQTNGDCFDNNYANLSHGIAWLENLGGTRFERHELMGLPGAYRALAGDMDGDGDSDIVAVANLPATIKPLVLREREQVSIVVLEQTEPGAFQPRVLERGTPRYPGLEVADFNGDGKLDFAVGAQLFDSEAPGSPSSRLPRLAVWWQQ